MGLLMLASALFPAVALGLIFGLMGHPKISNQHERKGVLLVVVVGVLGLSQIHQVGTNQVDLRMALAAIVLFCACYHVDMRVMHRLQDWLAVH